MKESIYKSYDELPLFLNSELVAKVLGVSPSSGYELMHQPDFPVLRVGNRMLVPKEQFIQWVAEHTEGGTCGCQQDIFLSAHDFAPPYCLELQLSASTQYPKKERKSRERLLAKRRKARSDCQM